MSNMSTSSNNEKLFAGETLLGTKSQGNRIARRARSFKEDFLEIISQMRSPGGSLTRSASPSSQKNQVKQIDFLDRNLNKNSVQDLDCNIKQVFLALKHFKDVINKNKLEMLPGNGTIVLDTVTAIHVLLKQYGLNEQSSTLVSTTNQVYQSVAQLVKLCDDYLLMGEKAFEKENVTEIVNSVELAVQNLVALMKDKINTKECNQKLIIDASPVGVKNKPKILTGTNNLDFNQRSSLPDIPLTPREREILEKTSAFALERHSQSIENILEDSPPPKPPHPDRINVNSFPPPLPPKTRQKNSNDVTNVKNNMEYLSLRSKSLEDSSSQLSISTGSVDSVLNHCREENTTDFVENHLQRNDIEKNCQIKNKNDLCWDYSFSSKENFQANVQNTTKISVEISESSFRTENSSNRVDYSESGVVSLPSGGGSCQSFSTSHHLSSSSLSHQSHTNQESHHTEKQTISVMESGSTQKVQLLNIIGCPDHLTCQKKVSTKKITDQVSHQKQPNICCNCGASSCENFISSSFPENIRSDIQEMENPLPFDRTQTTTTSLKMTEKRCFLSEVILEDKKNSVEINKVEQKLVESEMSNNVTKLTFSNTSLSLEGQPPPLPPKKKHIMAYMEMFGNASHANANEFLRHSVHAYNLLQSEWQQHQRFLNSTQTCSFSTYCDSNQKISTLTNGLSLETETKSLPPALPPKKRTRSNTNSPPPTPLSVSDDIMINRVEEKGNKQFNEISTNGECVRSDVPPAPVPSTVFPNPAVIDNSITKSNKIKTNEEVFLLDKLHVSDYLVFKKEEEEGPDLRGGHPDALVVHATKAQKNDFIYQEAFLTTYRTFLSPLELIQKLCYRYEKFSNSQDPSKQRAARESFSLLVRVVSDLTLTDLEQVILQTLMEFVQQLLCRGDLTMAKALRVIMLNKYEAKKLYLSCSVLLPSHNISTRQFLLSDFKSEQIAEQMTLLDAELFSKIEIPEVLNWAQEQNEERSPNLTKFTEHFNKMSYWARSKILEQNDARDREKYVIKFIKVMKYLRKINNFNSYLALLSALDSAPIRRLEWQKNITEGLKEYCALIDSSSSFRAYRLALAETHPPCIPYIGLVLQDLTFVHIGNTNTLPTGEVNFSKRWQQFNIVENMKRFKKVSYPYKKSDKIIAFFNGFDDSLSEEAMWQISEKIKPRGGKKA